MSEPFKLDASEVEFWKACVVAAVRGRAASVVDDADEAVMALRERALTQANGRRQWMECSVCGKKLDASSLLPRGNFICCRNTMIMKP